MNKIAMLTASLMLAGALLAQETFFKDPIVLSGSAGGTGVAPLVLDFDGDGLNDLLYQSWGPLGFCWRKNLGAYQFGGEQFISPTLKNLTGLEAHDLQGDGLMDLVFVTYEEHRLYTMTQTAPGVWSAPNPVTASMEQPQGVGVGDFNGDGLQDVFELDWLGHEVVAYVNVGESFSPSGVVVSEVPYPRVAKWVDLDGDGQNSLVVGHHGWNGIWEYTWSDGEWVGEQLSGGDGAQRLEFLDWDGDGDLDVVFDNHKSMTWVEQTDTTWYSHDLFNTGHGVRDFLVTGDLGEWELVVSLPNPDEVRTYAQVEGVWQAVHVENVPCASIQQVEFEAGQTAVLLQQDANAHAYPDWTSVDWGEGVKLHTSDLATPWYSKWAQLDGDPELEVVVAGNNSNRIEWFDRQAEGVWGASQLLTDLVVRPFSMDAKDIDNDGDDDLLVVGRDESRVAWIENLGNGDFSGLNTVSVTVNVPRLVEWVDIEGDGDLDIVTSSSTDKTVVLFTNNGSNQYDSGVVVASSEWEALAMDFEDYNGDGLLDIIIGWQSEGGVATQTAPGQFAYETLGRHDYPGENRVADAFGAVWGDANGDGLLDAVFGNGNGWDTEAVWFQSDGEFDQGAWLATRSPNVRPPHRTRSMEWLDLDLNGVPEIVGSKYPTPYVTSITFNEFGEYAHPISLTEEVTLDNSQNDEQWRYPDFRDADGDGDLDLLMSHPWNHWVVVMTNDQEHYGCTNPEACNYEPGSTIDDGSCRVPGESCDDGLAATYNDAIQSDCSCLGNSFDGELLYRINCGADYPWSDVSGQVWHKDTLFQGGSLVSTHVGVNQTLDDTLYRWSRYNPAGYQLPVPEDGPYLMRLHFAVIWGEVNMEGFQHFDVMAEGQILRDDFDVFTEAGGVRYTKVAVEHIVQVEDGVLNLTLEDVEWRSDIAGIELFQYTGDCVDVDLDDVCDDLEVFGCTYEEACNFNPEATQEDFSCDFVSCAGCMEPEACNFDAEATFPDASCEWPADFRDCDGACLNDLDGDGVCDEEEVAGCTYPTATNYSSWATDDDGTCVFDGPAVEFGCTYPSACNFNSNAVLDDGSCEFAAVGYDCSGNCLSDMDQDGICDEYEGCTIEGACNFNPMAIDNSGCCVFPDPGADCTGNCASDTDGDGICDENEIPGCLDEQACNYSQIATDESGFCFYPEPGYDCDGVCVSDLDGDGVCDGNEVLGCQDPTACNYDPLATEPDGTCTYPDWYVDCAGVCILDADGDGVCDALEVPGCTYTSAANFNAAATDDDGTCIFDGSTGALGCVYSHACNYDPNANADDGSCEFALPGLDCDGACLNDCDGDGICDADEVMGCMDETACNYDPLATDAVENCEFISCSGCMDAGACNYDASAQFENGSCEYVTCLGCMHEAACNFDEGALISDGSCEYTSCAGCTYPIASNYDPSATIDDGSCEFLPYELCDGPDCPGDFNEDLVIGTFDLLTMLSMFGTICE